MNDRMRQALVALLLSATVACGGREVTTPDQFDTKAKSVKVELAFLQAPGVKEVTLSYSNVPAGPALKVSR